MRDVTAFSVGDIIATSFRVYFNNLPTFLPLSLIVFLPLFAVVLIPESSSVNNPVVLDPSQVTRARLLEFGLVNMREAFVLVLCGVWLQAAFAFGVVRTLRGGSIGFAEMFAHSLRLLLPAILVALVVALATTVGFLLLIVPGVIVALVLWVAVPAAVVERSGLRALGRSARLTDGFKGQIFGLALILILSQFVAGSVVALLIGAVTSVTFVVWLGSQLFGILLSGIWATAVSVTYHDLRVVKEGVDTQVVARVFD